MNGRRRAVASRNLTGEGWRAHLGETQTDDETAPDLPAPADKPANMAAA